MSYEIKNEKKIISKEREKQNGEVFTPKELVLEMLNKIPKEDWKDPDKTFLEPSAGDGNFLVKMFEYRVRYKVDPIQALRTLYGVDLMEDNVYDCRQRLLHIFARWCVKKVSKEYLKENIKEAEEIVNNNIVIANSLEFHYWDKDLSDSEKGDYITFDKNYKHVDRTSTDKDKLVKESKTEVKKESVKESKTKVVKESKKETKKTKPKKKTSSKFSSQWL